MFDLSPDYRTKCHRFLRRQHRFRFRFSFKPPSVQIPKQLLMCLPTALHLLQVVARSRGGVATIATVPARTARQFPLSIRRTAYAGRLATRASGPGWAAVGARRRDPIRLVRHQHRQPRIIIPTWMMRTVRSVSVKLSTRNLIANRCVRQIRRIRIRHTVSVAR